MDKPSRYGQGRGGRPWRRKVERIKVRDAYTCRACGRVTEDGEVDHITPLARNGSDDEANLAYLCVPCHRAKTAREMGHKVVIGADPDGWPIAG